MDEATQAQNRAARPGVSTWLTANAGSGKTRVLTNRVARLLLNGVQPENILCLTYTTAAASEMQNRLFKTLGAWAMLPDADLKCALAQLGESPPDDPARARTLFASAIEAPGGLKIQTIHSFCSKILRQFPLEAGVNPQFRELDDAAQTALISTVIEEIAIAKPTVLEQVRRAYSGDSISDLAKDIAKQAERFEQPRSRDSIFEAFRVPAGQSLAKIIEQNITIQDIAFLKSLVSMLRDLGSSNDLKLASALSDLPDRPSAVLLTALEDCLLTKEKAKEPFSFKRTIPTVSVRKESAFAPLLPEFVAIGERIELARKERIALEVAEHAVALYQFARTFLPRYSAAKADAAALDFDDLIRRTKQLLSTRSLAWVLFRLDSRIDHVLVDEAQDTSPAQWDIIEALTAEMIAEGTGRSRTLFVVGDKKQSIYSFQGADATGFDARAEEFAMQLSHGPGLAKGELLHSFRSSSAILNVVDTVFSGDDGTGGPTRHMAFHEAMSGRVDLWPLIPKPDKEDERLWYDASERIVDTDAAHELGLKLAEYIEDLLKKGTIQGENGHFRRVEPSDIMVLVQRRSTLFDKIIAACKARKLQIAGADRLRVGSELAVRDILALLSFLALPEDDLSLAAALRSPLLGWTEADLYELAAKRKSGTFLWQELRSRRSEFPETHEVLAELRDRVDFDRPYELIHAILTRFNGRERLLQRLGHEAEDGIDELMNQALVYESEHVPSLTGFLAVARASDIEVKRENESSGNLIRVMTVHGSKGLESPIVILPDTTFTPTQSRQRIVEGASGIPVLTRGKDKSTQELLAAKEGLKSVEEAERDRLLYVAMTRAEKWLIVCGVQPSQQGQDQLDWHKRIMNGLEAMGADPIDTPFGPGLRISAGDWKSEPQKPEHEEEPEREPLVLPSLAPLRIPEAPVVLKPSELGETKVLDGEYDGPSGGLAKGRQMHLLLEHLPGARDPANLAMALLSAGPDAASPEDIRSLTAEANEIIRNNARIFGPDTLAEVEFVATSSTLGARITGAIDRLIVEPDRVLAVDFKTNAVVPKHPRDTPEGILRQMGAYLEALETIYPEREIRLAVLWTTSGQLMPLEHGMVRDALRRATIS